MASSAGRAVYAGLRPDLSCAPVPVAHGGLKRRPGWGVAGSSAPSCPPRPCRFRMASVAGRAEKTSSSAGRAGWGFLSLVPADRDRAAHRWPQAPAGLGCGVVGLRPSVPVVTLGVTDWPQSPAGLGFGVAGLRPCVPAVTLRVTDGLKRRPGCEVRGAFAGWVGRGRTGVPPHKLQGAGSIGARRPSVQFAAGAPRHDPALPSRRRLPAGGRRTRPSPIDLCGERKHSRWSLWRGPVSATASSTLRRLAAYETVGWGRVGVPPQQTAHTAVLKRLTPHPAVCEEVPRRGPAPPTHRRNREPDSPAGV